MNWRKYGFYHLRWQSGFLFNWIIFYICIDMLGLKTWLTVIIFQFLGAIVYWYVDKYIFSKEIKMGIRTKMFFWRFFNPTKYKDFKDIERKFRKACKSPEVQKAFKSMVDTVIKKTIKQPNK